MKVRVHLPGGRIHGDARVPRSKPHMQRAILLSLLTNAPNVVVHPAWSSESRDLFDAAQRFGLEVDHHDATRLVITGTGRSIGQPGSAISTARSAFNFRTVAALGCLVPGETVIEGDASMRARPLTEYLNFIGDLGARMEDISDAEHLRIRVHGCLQLGGETTIDTRHSSQVLTAALLIAPLADRPVRIHCDDSGLVGEGYVDLTLAMMREQGAVVARTGSEFVITPSAYQSRLHLIASDFTALSYLAGAVVVAPEAQIVVRDYHPSALSSEREFFAVLRRLGVQATYDPVARSMHLQRTSPEADSIDIDGRNIPTVVPTLAAIAPFIEARVTVRNVAHVDNHKCPRVTVMLRELERMGCQVTPIRRRDGLVDGFSTSGRQRPAGGVELDSHGDHRVFMSLATAALGARLVTTIDGSEHLQASFPDFLAAMAQLGARCDADEPGLAREPVALTTKGPR